MVTKLLSSRKGFTLVELMVVIAIIAILAVIGFAIFNGQQVNARNARRRQDLEAIANALEANRALGTTYPSLAATFFANNTIPIDPSGATNRVYCAASNTAQIPNLTTVNWSTLNTCPLVSGVQWNPVTTPAPATGAFWTVCVMFENPNSVACRSNQQS